MTTKGPRVQLHAAGQIYHRLVDYEIIKQLKDLTCKGHPRGIQSFRNLYEDYDGKESCAIVRGPIISGHTKCYLSGLAIDQTDAGLTGEGEHLLPVYKAIAYLSLIYKSDGYKVPGQGNKLFYEPTPAQILEFDWACRVANQEKSDTDYTKVVDDQFRTDEDAITADLRKMWNSKRADAVEFKKRVKKIYKTENAFISERLPYLKGRFDEICAYINGKIEQHDAPLMHLVGLARIIDSQIPAAARDLIRASPHPHLFTERSLEERQEISKDQLVQAQQEAADALLKLSCPPASNNIYSMPAKFNVAQSLINMSQSSRSRRMKENNRMTRHRNESPRRYQNNIRNRRGGKRKTRKNVKTNM